MSVPGQGVRPQVNKFEHVSNDDHQMSVAGVGYPGKYDILGGILPCDLSHDACNVTCLPLDRMTDRHLRKHYLPTTSLGKRNLWQHILSLFENYENDLLIHISRKSVHNSTHWSCVKK